MLRTFLPNLRTFLPNSKNIPRYLYYVQKNFEDLGETENKDYKIYYKIIIKYQFLFFEILDFFSGKSRYSLDVLFSKKKGKLTYSNNWIGIYLGFGVWLRQ